MTNCVFNRRISLFAVLMWLSACVVAADKTAHINAADKNGNDPDRLSLGSLYVAISDAYVRGLPPGQKVTAAFFTLKNNSDGVIVLSEISSPDASKIEIHETKTIDGQMQMRVVEGLTIQSGETVVFEPSAKHIMMKGLTRSLKEGDKVSLRLCFDDFCRVLDLPVMSVLNEGTQSHHHH